MLISTVVVDNQRKHMVLFLKPETIQDLQKHVWEGDVAQHTRERLERLRRKGEKKVEDIINKIFVKVPEKQLDNVAGKTRDEGDRTDKKKDKNYEYFSEHMKDKLPSKLGYIDIFNWDKFLNLDEDCIFSTEIHTQRMKEQIETIEFNEQGQIDVYSVPFTKKSPPKNI